MLALWNALSCGFVGAIASYAAYTQSNLFLLGESVRRGRHLFWDPLAFTLLGALFGLVVGAACGLWLAGAKPYKPIVLGLAVTLASIAATAGIVTWRRYRALPRDPVLSGPATELAFELRLPLGNGDDAKLPKCAVMGSGVAHATDAVFAPATIDGDGRRLLPGRVRLRFAVDDRMLSFLDSEGRWVNFDIRLPAQPTAADTAWTDWQVACNADPGRPAAQEYQLRYRVHVTGGR
jgi:hypothetical protein